MSDETSISPIKPAVISISSHVVRGSVGNRAAAFAFEALGFPAWVVPTVTLSWHPGHGPATRYAATQEDFESLIDDMIEAPWIGEVGGILTGYLANPHQAECAARLFDKLKQTNPQPVYLCDPVIGDEGGLYVLEDTANAIKEHLLPLADIVTPNRFELGWLSGASTPQTRDEAVQLASSLAPENVLVTSCPGTRADEMGNLFCKLGRTDFAGHGLLDNPPNGLGDLTAALFLAHWLDGLSAKDNLSRTTASVYEMAKQALRRGKDELTLESDAAILADARLEIEVTES